MIDGKEEQLREMVVRLSHEEGRKVVREMTAAWDRGGEGCFKVFIEENYPVFWLAKVRRN